MSLTVSVKAILLARRFGASYERGIYELIPSVFYPTMIAHIQEAITRGELPGELIDRPPQPGIDPQLAARTMLKTARAIPEQAWKDALIPREEFADVQRIRNRAQALECARLWFTRAAKNLHRGSLTRIHIHKDLRFKL